MLELKIYQKDTLAALREYLLQAQVRGPQIAFARTVAQHPTDNTPQRYHDRWGMADVPYVCLRLPTGGGKTLLAAHSVGLAAQAFNRPFSLVLWLVPTNIIKQQTVQALNNPMHHCREALDSAFGQQNVAVFDIEDINTMRPKDVFDKTCVVVSTMQTLRVENSNKDSRKVYGHNENLEPHFARLGALPPDNLDCDAQGRPLYSFVNLAHVLRPIVIVDEAHKMVSQLSGEVMQRLNPACVLEYTATPVESNVLWRVFPSALKVEEMVKLPFMLVEHANWEEAVLAALQRRAQLGRLAQNDADYIRPLILFQAEKKNQTCTVDVLKEFLLQQGVPEREIAIATGEQRELDAINVFDKNCPVTCIITVEALKEGWDCSFAYVFCSVANVGSSTDVEQLLGRVMRMPYARARSQSELNMAYAHVLAPSFTQAVSEMYNHMLHMGFGDAEALQALQPETNLLPGLRGLREEPAPFGESPMGRLLEPALRVTLSRNPKLDDLPEEDTRNLHIREDNGTFVIIGPVSDTVEERLLACVPERARPALRRDVAMHRQHRLAMAPASPAKRGEPFVVPQLLVEFDGVMTPVEDDILAGLWSPLEFVGQPPLTQAEFGYDDQALVFQIDLDGERLVYHSLGTLGQYSLFQPPEDALALSRELDHQCRQDDISQPDMLEFCRMTVQGLLESGIALPVLYRGKNILAAAIRQKIAALRNEARKRGYQQMLFAPQARVEVNFRQGWTFPQAGYAAAIAPYTGAYHFAKHYYDVPRELKASGEEFCCARAIDMDNNVKFWLRNVDRQQGSFSLPTSTDRFYPDFVVQLLDGRIVLVEYKGQHLLSTDDTKEKRNIGELWAAKSNGKGIFLLVTDARGQDFSSQLQRALRQ